jgi:hypothetical protein
MLKSGMAAALAGGLVGFLVNDSGAVVWGLVTAVPLAALLDVMLAARDAPEFVDANHGARRRREDSGRGDQR